MRPLPLAVGPELEETILGNLHSVLAWLGGEDAGVLAAFREHLVSRTSTWLPPDRNALVAGLMLSATHSENPVTPRENPVRLYFLVILLREALRAVDEAQRSSFEKRLLTLDWCRRYWEQAGEFLCDEHRSPSTVSFAPEASRKDWQAGLRGCRDGILKFMRIEGAWVVRHSITGTPVNFCGGLWQPGHTVWIKSRETVTIGDQLLDTRYVELLMNHQRAHVVCFDLTLDGPEIRLCQSSEGDPRHQPTLRWGAGFTIIPVGAHALALNGCAISQPTPMFPSDKLCWAGREFQGASLIRAVLIESNMRAFALSLKHAGLRFPDGSHGLRDLSFQLQSGDFVAVMGVSGCGKSTLLTALAGEMEFDEGAIETHSADGSHPVRAFVPQDDVLFAELTVEENLDFAGCLRTCPKELRKSRIREVFSTIQLGSRSRLRVGGPLKKVLSGGERKRLNIGLELMGNPDALFLDEPTSGLSSSDAREIMAALKEKADEGMLVVAVVHQPAEEIFLGFGKVLILDEGGRLAFFGTPAGALEFFSGVAGKSFSGADGILNLMGARRTTLDGLGQRRVYSPEFWQVCFASVRTAWEPLRVTGALRPCRDDMPKKEVPRNKIGIVLVRELLRRAREWRTTLVSVSAAFVLGLIIAVACRFQADTGTGYTYANNVLIPVAVFLLVILMTFLGLAISTQEIVKDRVLMARERQLGIPGFFWVLGKLPGLLGVSLAQVAVVVITAGWLLALPTAYLPLLALTLFLTAFCAVSLGLLVSSIPGITERIAVSAIPLLILPQMILCGAEPFAYDRLAHLRWPSARSVEDRAPFFTAVIPARWAYEAAILQLKTLPDIHEASQDRVILTTYNWTKGNIQTWSADRETFLSELGDRLGYPVDANWLIRTLSLSIRGGYRTPAQAAEEVGVILPNAADLTADLRTSLNLSFINYAGKTFPDDNAATRSPAPALLRLAAIGGVLLAACGLLLHGSWDKTFKRTFLKGHRSKIEFHL